jgi:hypothetical protein
LVGELLAYQQDLLERIVLFWDALRERADNMLEHERAGLPALLDFKYETLLDARRFERPANYALLRITEIGERCWSDCVDLEKPPVIIIDPRAGHGPGIGGFKRESEVGMAMREGHPVYFVIFFPQPAAGQTLADVLHALRRFVEEVARRHDGRAPVLYGNCQAGWAITLLSADCEGLVGPTVLNGSQENRHDQTDESRHSGNCNQSLGHLRRSGGCPVPSGPDMAGRGEPTSSHAIPDHEEHDR